MSDFNFMRSGIDMLETNHDDMSKDFMRKVVSIMTVLCEESLKTAAQFAECCGRETITSSDTMMALKYESRVFWDKDIDQRFMEHMNEERMHTYDTDEEDGEDEDDGEEGDEDGEEDEGEYFHTTYVQGDEVFHQAVVKICEEWHEWQPTDPVKKLLKDAIEKTDRRFATLDD